MKAKKDTMKADLNKKYGAGEVDKDALKARDQTMKGILGGLKTIPEKLHMIGELGVTSAKAKGPRHNELSGKEGKWMNGDLQ